MTDADVQPDIVVRTALQRLPVPAHADDFWTRLEASLDAEPTPATAARSNGAVATLPVAAPLRDLDRDPALALVPSALRRTSNALLVAVAAAAVVVVALAGNTLLDARDGTQQVTSDDDEASAELDALLDDAQPEAATPSTMSAAGEDVSSEAVLTWVDDLRAGHGEEAWGALGPGSKAHFGTQGAFEEQMTSLADGYGTWAGSQPEQVLITPIQADDDSTLAVVTLVGTVMVDGVEQHRADAFPVRVVDGEAHLEPWAFAGEMEVVVPEDVPADGTRPPVDPGEELIIVVPAGAQAPVLRLDDGEAVICGKAEGTELTDLEDTPGQRCAYLPQEGIGAGEHTLTVAFLGADGTSISAASLLFDAA
jgi:hypothetical protein